MYYDFKAGNIVIYEKNIDELEKVLEKYQEIMKQKNCTIVIETPGSLPTEEIKKLEIFFQNRGLNIIFTRPSRI